VTGPTRILLADDEPDILAVLKKALESAGYVVATALDGAQALDSIRSSPPDLAVLDLNMPRKDGLEVLRALRADPIFQHLPVMLLTSAADTPSKVAGLDVGADDYLTKPINLDEFLARLRMILRRTRLGLEANPLTKLPGNPAIEARLEQALRSGVQIAVLYVDLNQFKAYNDAYGYDAGDRVIRRLAEILLRHKGPEDFVGHIGGDDFIVITRPEAAEGLCQRLIRSFDQAVPGFYTEEDRTRGFIESQDRQGRHQTFPLLSLAIGVATNTRRRLHSVGQVSQIGSELKRYAKTFKGSKYVVDRRME